MKREIVDATRKKKPQRINLFHELSLPVGYHSRSLNVCFPGKSLIFEIIWHKDIEGRGVWSTSRWPAQTFCGFLWLTDSFHTCILYIVFMKWLNHSVARRMQRCLRIRISRQFKNPDSQIITKHINDSYDYCRDGYFTQHRKSDSTPVGRCWHSVKRSGWVRTAETPWLGQIRLALMNL